MKSTRIIAAALVAASLAGPMAMTAATPTMAGSKVEEVIKVTKDAVREAEKIAKDLAKEAKKAAEKAAKIGTKAAKKAADKAARAAKEAADKAEKAAAAAVKIGKKLKDGSIIAEPVAVLLGAVPPESKELGLYNQLWWPLRPFIAE